MAEAWTRAPFNHGLASLGTHVTCVWKRVKTSKLFNQHITEEEKASGKLKLPEPQNAS